MPFALIIVGLVLLTAGARDTQDDLLALVKSDLFGSPSYLTWAIAILIIGAIGYIDALRPISRSFLALVLLVMFLTNGGFFTKFNQQFLGQQQ